MLSLRYLVPGSLASLSRRCFSVSVSIFFLPQNDPELPHPLRSSSTSSFLCFTSNVLAKLWRDLRIFFLFSPPSWLSFPFELLKLAVSLHQHQENQALLLLQVHLQRQLVYCHGPSHHLLVCMSLLY